MRIGIFTDVYHPAINGVVFTVESTRRQLEALGHEVYIFCPAARLRPGIAQDDHVVRYRSIRGGLYSSYDISLVFPQRAVRDIAKLRLDIVHYVSLGQMGMLGMYVSRTLGIPAVAQHCTDFYQFANYYSTPRPVAAGVVAMLGHALGLSPGQLRRPLSIAASSCDPSWRRDIVQWGTTMAYRQADCVLAMSRKSQRQLQSWRAVPGGIGEARVLPNGVDAMPQASASAITDWRRRLGVADDAPLVLSVGRLAAEKNLSLLIDMMGCMKQERAVLVFVGDFEYRAQLEAYARASPVADRVLFAGAMPRQELGVAYGAADVFVMPSLTDTQGWVLHEAAHAGLPIVMCDAELSEVVVNGDTGYIVAPTARAFAGAVDSLLADSALRRRMGQAGRCLARQFTEAGQVQKLAAIYRSLVSASRS